MTTTTTTSIVDPTKSSPFSGETYRKNADRTESKGFYACPCCGKAIKDWNSESTLYVEVVYVQDAEGHTLCGYRAEDGTGEQLPQLDSQGCFQVGASCAKKLRRLGAAVFTLDPLA